jgi:hypothetical protein
MLADKCEQKKAGKTGFSKRKRKKTQEGVRGCSTVRGGRMQEAAAAGFRRSW